MSDPDTSGRVLSLDDPQLRSFLPLLYVAWADLALPEREREALRNKIAEQPWLRPVARSAALSWLDPTQPPTAREFEDLSRLLARVAKTASLRARATFHGLAKQLSVSPESDAAVEELAGLLGTDIALPAAWDAVEETPQPVYVGDAATSLHLARFLDGRHHAVRAQVRAFLDSPERRAYGLSSDEMRDHTRRQLEEFSRTGLIEKAFPGVTSDQGLDVFMAIFEELGHGDLSLTVKLGVQAGLYGGAIWALGTERHHKRLPRVARLQELGCFAMSEVGHGSNVADLETVARYDHVTRELVITTPGESARKEWIGGAARDARFAAVFAQLEVEGVRHGVHAVIVPIRAVDGSPLAGVRTGDSGHKMGLLGVDNGRLWFEDTRVPIENLLDRFARIDEAGHYQSPIESQGRRFFTMLGTLVGGRICVGSAGVSAARTSLAIAIRYATMRRQFGAAPSEPERALLEYPSHRRRLLPALAQNVVLRVAFEAIRERHASSLRQQSAKTGGRAAGDKNGAGRKPSNDSSAQPPIDPRRLEAEVAILKVLGSRHGVDATQACREACGGQGYLSVNRLADMRRDVEIFTTFEGDNVVLSQLVAKAILSDYRSQFADEGAFGVARLIGRRALGRAVDKNPMRVRLRDPAHLRSREFQSATLRYRQEHVVETLAARLRKRLGEGMDFDLAFLEVQEHVLAAAQAFGERLAFDAFVEAERKFNEVEGGGAADDTKPRPGGKADDVPQPEPGSPAHLLGLLGDAYALGVVESHAAWFLEDGWVEVSKSRAIRVEQGRVLAELAPHARTIVDSFCIPDACLAAPIAFFDPAHPRYG